MKAEKKKNNKRGSAAVFLTMVLPCMVAVALTLNDAAAQTAYVSRCDAVVSLSGRSVLSEFDLNLKEEYGLFGFYGLSEDVEKKLKRYLGETLGHKEIGSVSADLSQYALTNLGVFEEQVVEGGKYGFAKGFPQGEKENQVETIGQGNALKNQAVIKHLPSEAMDAGGLNMDEIATKLKDVSDLDGLMTQGGNLYMTTEYIMKNFKHNFQQEIGRETFFNNEVEYILEGKLSDATNKRAVENDFIALRTALNTAHIYADPKKRSGTLAAAELLTPGPPALITQAIITAGWGLIEAKNDASLLLNGENVALAKTEETWAIDLSMITITADEESCDVNFDNGPGGYVRPDSDRGLSYEEYLKLFLVFQSREIKLARMMDLIQINMKGIYDEDFLLKDYHAGMTCDIWIKGEKYGCEEKY